MILPTIVRSFAENNLLYATASVDRHLLKPPLNCIVFANDSKLREDDCITDVTNLITTHTKHTKHRRQSCKKRTTHFIQFRYNR